MQFLVMFALSEDYNDFILDEVNVLLEMEGLIPHETYDISAAKTSLATSPYLIVNLPSVDTAIAVFRRAVLVKFVYKLYGHGLTYDELLSSINTGQMEAEGLFAPEHSWCVAVDAYGKSLARDEQQDRRIQLAPYLPFQGPVNVKKPALPFHLIEDIGMHMGSHAKPRHIYFGLFITEGLRSLVNKLNLKTRPYLGPTSLVPELGLLMANQAKVQPGHFVLDPFVGTGGIAVPAAELGGFVVGGDIDIRVLKGKQGRNLGTCYKEYGLGVPELVRMDNHMRCYRELPMFHSIICDPPYGVRAGARKSGVEKREPLVIAPEQRASIIPATSTYAAVDVMSDLLEAAARNLIIGGRLAYLLPTAVGYTDAELPVHPCLRVVSNSEQKLSGLLSRRLVTMEKVCEYDWSKTEEYQAIAELHAASAPSYADLKKRINEHKATHGGVDQRQVLACLAAFGEEHDEGSVDSESKDAASTSSSRRPDAATLAANKERKRQLNISRWKDVAPEKMPVGLAPFDRD